MLLRIFIEEKHCKNRSYCLHCSIFLHPKKLKDLLKPTPQNYHSESNDEKEQNICTHQHFQIKLWWKTMYRRKKKGWLQLIINYSESLACFLFTCCYLLKPSSTYLLKVNNINIGTSCEICSKVTIKTPEWYHGVSIVNFEHISQLALVFLLLILNMQLPAVKIDT